MVKVITYGTFDLLHNGHIRLLQRAKALGDYLIVGVTSDDFDKTRGKINIQQSLIERMEAVKALGIADMVIVEEYEGQKIDDIRKYEVDIFTVGSDWVGKFDYLNDYCRVIYLPRTEGISSTEIRSAQRNLRLGFVGESHLVGKFRKECSYVNGVDVVGICSADRRYLMNYDTLRVRTQDYGELLEQVDAVYIASHPSVHAEQIRLALNKGIHVICESPIAMTERECRELFRLAHERNCVLMDAIKTAYSTAYSRLLGLLKSGKIGRIRSVDATCTSLREVRADDPAFLAREWNSMCFWGPTAMLPVFELLGTDFCRAETASLFADPQKRFDTFTKIDWIYPDAVASIKIGNGVKSEGSLVVSGSNGYLYVPAPWWKTDYFEVRYEDINETKKFFYQLDGEGIRYEIVAFVRNILNGRLNSSVPEEISAKICAMIERSADAELSH